jgi:hypothetical protein
MGNAFGAGSYPREENRARKAAAATLSSLPTH